MRIIEAGETVFSVKESSRYVAVWVLGGPGRDYLGILFQDPGGPLTFRYRFRYHRDDKIWEESEDVKNTRNADFSNKTEDEAISAIDDIVRAELIERGYCGSRLPWLVKKRHVRRVTKCDGRAFAKILMNLPFMHVKRLGEGN